jgi:hypothetical protein
LFSECADGALLNVQPSRQQDLLTPDCMRFTPGIANRQGVDLFRNIWTRLIARPGRLEIRNEFVIRDSGLRDEVVPDARQFDVDELPDDVLPFL